MMRSGRVQGLGLIIQVWYIVDCSTSKEDRCRRSKIEGAFKGRIMRWPAGWCHDLGGLLHVHGSVQNYHALPGFLVGLVRIHHGLVHSLLHGQQRIHFHHMHWPWVGGARRRYLLQQFCGGWHWQQLGILPESRIQRRHSSTQ